MVKSMLMFQIHFQDEPFLGFQTPNLMGRAYLSPPEIVRIQDYCRKFYQAAFNDDYVLSPISHFTG